jgi:uncharacterized membrane protein/uncharacterized membrane protein YeaQ/YmgE (transglycosylase-associated protein family)
MHVWLWLLTGLAAGVVARLVLKGVRLSLGAELALGGIGGVATGALLRFAGLTSPASSAIHIAVSLVGAIGMIATMHLALRATRHAHGVITGAAGPADLGARLAALGEREQHVLGKFLRRETITRNAEAEDREHATLGQRAADRIAAFGGSWAFMGLFFVVLTTWMLYNSETARPFDAYPFILLNLLLSCIAAIQAPIILMSQNRQAEKDRLNARLDYEVNLKAEVEILSLHEKMDALRDRAWNELLEMQRRQLALLEKLEEKAL